MTTPSAATPTPVFLTRFIHKIDSGLDWVYRIFGYVCGSLLLILGIYITYQVIMRKLGGPILGNQELVGGYILAFAGTWAFSYSLRTGSHVRIDVLLPLFSRIHPYVRSAADWMALGSVGFFGLITAIKSWEEVAESKCIRTNAEGMCEPALANTYLIGNFFARAVDVPDDRGRRLHHARIHFVPMDAEHDRAGPPRDLAQETPGATWPNWPPTPKSCRKPRPACSRPARSNRLFRPADSRRTGGCRHTEESEIWQSSLLSA